MVYYESVWQKSRGFEPWIARIEARRYQGVRLSTLGARLRRSAPTLGPRGCLADTAFFAAVLATKFI